MARAATLDELERAKTHAEAITHARLAGFTTAQIARKYRLPVAAISAIESLPVRRDVRPFEEERAPDPAPAPAAGPAPAPSYSSGERPMQPPPPWPYPSVPPEQWMAHVQRGGPAQSTPEPSPAAVGAYDMTNTTDMIFQLCLDNLIPQAKARGIARRFDAKRADDYAGLAHILATAGVSIPAQRAVVEAYRELTASTDGSHDSPDPFAGLTGDSMNPLEGLDAAADKTWAKEMRRRMIEAQVTSAERRARGLDNPNAPTPGTSTAESEAIKIIREQLETTRRELSEVKHQGELKNLETRLSGEIAALKQATAAPTAAEVEARAKSDLTKVVTTELSKRADGAGTIVKTGRERILQNPKLLAKLEHAIETAVDDFDPSNRIPPGMQPHDPSDAELQQLVDEIESRNPAPKPAKPSAEAPRFRIPTRPAEAQPPAPAPSAAPAPEPAGYQSG